MATAKVLADANGNIINVSNNNPEYGYIRVGQTVMMINERGWLKATNRTALIHGTVEELKQAGFQKDQEIPGKIVVIESFAPFNQENPDKDLKIAGDTNVICRVDDQPIYRNTFFTSNENASDELIMHDNAAEIREVRDAQRAIEGLTVAKKATEAVEL